MTDEEAEREAWRVFELCDGGRRSAHHSGFVAALRFERSRQSEREAALERVSAAARAVVRHWTDTGSRDLNGDMLIRALKALDHPAPIEPEPERKGDEVESAEAFAERICVDLPPFLRPFTEKESGWLLDAIHDRDDAVRAAAIREFADYLNTQVFEDNAQFAAILNIAAAALTAPASSSPAATDPPEPQK